MININVKKIFKSGNRFFGVLCFQHDDFYFPEKEWNDFIIIILNWWALALERLINKEVSHEELLFMDGPFSVKIEHKEQETLELFFYNDDKIVHSCQMSIQLFFKDFLSSVNKVIRELDLLKWENEEILNLKASFIRLNSNKKHINSNINSD